MYQPELILKTIVCSFWHLFKSDKYKVEFFKRPSKQPFADKIGNAGQIDFQIDIWTDSLSSLHYYSFLELSTQFEALELRKILFKKNDLHFRGSKSVDNVERLNFIIDLVKKILINKRKTEIRLDWNKERLQASKENESE